MFREYVTRGQLPDGGTDHLISISSRKVVDCQQGGFTRGSSQRLKLHWKLPYCGLNHSIGASGRLCWHTTCVLASV